MPFRSSSSKIHSYEAFKLQKLVLSFLGFWHEHNDAFTLLRRLTSTSIIIAYLIIEYIVLYNYSCDLGLFFDHLCCLITPTVLIFKVAVLERRRDDFPTLLRCLLDKTFGDFPKSLNSHLHRSVAEMKLLRSAFLWLSMVIVGQMVATPFLKGEDLPLPVPFEVEGSGRWAMFAAQLVAFLTITLGNVCLDLLIVSMMSLGAAQLEILGGEIAMIGGEKTIGRDFREGVKADLRRCVEHHHAIKRYISCLEHNFTMNFLFQYAASIIVICVSGFQVVHIPFGTFRFFMMFFFFVDMMLELGMYCWYGNKIIMKSRGILDACYNSRWLDWDGDVRRSLLLIMENSKKPLKLTAGGFFTFSLGSFLAVLKSSYSYFAVMQQMYKEQKGKE